MIRIVSSSSLVLRIVYTTNNSRLLTLDLESDAAWFGFRFRHEFTNGFEDDTKLAIVLLLQLIEAPGKPLVRGDHRSKLNKRSHNGDIHLNCSLASQYAGEHRDTLLGKRIGIGPPETALT